MIPPQKATTSLNYFRSEFAKYIVVVGAVVVVPVVVAEVVVLRAAAVVALVEAVLYMHFVTQHYQKVY